MLDLPQLRTAIEDAIDGFTDRVGDIVPDAAASPKRAAAAPKRAAVASRANTPKRRTAAPKSNGGAVEPLVVVPAPEESRAALAFSPLGRKVYRVVSENPKGVTANDIADKVHVGFAPIFDELRSLMASGALVRIVRGDDQLPVYVLPKA